MPVEVPEAPPVLAAPTEQPTPPLEAPAETDESSAGTRGPTALPGPAPGKTPTQATASAAPAIPDATVPAPPPAPEASVLPSVVDLLYSAFWGTHGVVIGTVAYRFEHGDGRYRIETVGEGRGLIALLYPGQLKVASRGRLTGSGLLPDEFSVERGSRARHEVARFDRATGTLVLHDKDPQPLPPRTFDLLTFWLQFYFEPPAGEEVAFRVATTRSLREFRLRKSGEELLLTPLGEVHTHVWRRVGDAGDQDAVIWLAPQWHFLPVKVRLSNRRGTVEQMLLGVRAGLEIPESMQSTRRLELPLDEEGNWVQEDKFSERALTP